jgi:tetratricopeptide (TPR) repeat protein
MQESLGADRIFEQARAAAAAGAWHEVRELLVADTQTSAASGPRSLLLGDAYLWTGDPRGASVWLARAEPLLLRSSDRVAWRRAINMRGAASFAMGELSVAQAFFERALSVAQRDDDALLVSRTTNNLGLIAALRGELDEAIAMFHLALAAYQRLGNSRGLAESWHNLGVAYRTRGELDPAEDAERRAIEFAIEAGNSRLRAMAEVGRAEIALRRGDAAWARAVSVRAHESFIAIPDYLLAADSLRVTAVAADLLGRTEEADAVIAQALTMARAHEHLTQEAESLQSDAQIGRRRGDMNRARASGIAARDAFSRLGNVSASEELAEFLSALA